MDEIIISKHDFEKSKNQIKAFSEQVPQELGLNEVDIRSGPFGWGDHKVTGYELNELTKQIQKYLINFNTLHINSIKQFEEVYKALEALDKDYIKAILIEIKAIEEVNNEVKVAQSDITKTIEIQKKTINALKQFKEKIENYRHLVDIDKMWSDSQKLQNDVATVSNNVDELWDNTLKIYNEITSINSDIENFKEIANSQRQTLYELCEFKDSLDKCEHLKDIDILWNKTENIGEEVSKNTKRMDEAFSMIQSNEQSIDSLVQFKDRIDGYEHLKDIDETWDRCNTFELNISSAKDVMDAHQNQIETLQSTIQEIQEKNEEKSQSFSKKLKVAYVLTGSSIGITIIEFVLLMMRIL